MKPGCFSLLLLLALSFAHDTPIAWADKTSCLKGIAPLEKSRAAIGQLGGTWTLFESSHHLRDHSVDAIQLDSKASQILHKLSFLCNTLQGIPFNDLAQYIAESLKTMSWDEYRQQLRVLGKSPLEIETWYRFYQFSLKHENRLLQEDSILRTIAKAGHLMETYQEFAYRVEQAPRATQAQEARTLTESINHFFEEDSNMALATTELAQIPHWDIDEDVGGS